MKIQRLGMQTFGACQQYEIVKKHPDSFYKMYSDDKLDILYDMLKEQKQDHRTLALNQEKLQNCNYFAAKDILDRIEGESGQTFISPSLSYFNKNSINLIG